MPEQNIETSLKKLVNKETKHDITALKIGKRKKEYLNNICLMGYFIKLLI